MNIIEIFDIEHNKNFKLEQNKVLIFQILFKFMNFKTDTISALRLILEDKNNFTISISFLLTASKNGVL